MGTAIGRLPWFRGAFIYRGVEGQHREVSAEGGADRGSRSPEVRGPAVNVHVPVAAGTALPRPPGPRKQSSLRSPGVALQLDHLPAWQPVVTQQENQGRGQDPSASIQGAGKNRRVSSSQEAPGPSPGPSPGPQQQTSQ